MIESPPSENLAVIAIFSALGSNTRLALLDAVARQPVGLRELGRGHGMSAVAVSRHVAVLESAGLVSRQVIGRKHVVSANPATLKVATAYLDKKQKFWSERLLAIQAIVSAKGEKNA